MLKNLNKTLIVFALAFSFAKAQDVSIAVGDTAFAAASSAVALRADVRKLVAAVVAAHAAAAPGWAGSSSPPSPAELAVAAVI